MTVQISTERVFSLSAFEGLKLFRAYLETRVGVGTAELIHLIESIEPDGYALDLEAGAYLGTLIGDNCPLDGDAFYQTCIKAVVIQHQPIWAKTMRSGRKRFVSSLDQDDQDVFKAAGLMGNPPSHTAIKWWDDVVGHARLITDGEKMEQARQAELLSLDHERARLSELSISKEPEWPGLDDNFAGYDILSYDHGGYGLLNIMIEVKSTTASPLRFFISRNEWNQAIKAGPSYIFHVWDMAKEKPILYIRTVQQIEPHIPSDNEKGKWSNAAIPLGV